MLRTIWISTLAVVGSCAVVVNSDAQGPDLRPGILGRDDRVRVVDDNPAWHAIGQVNVAGYRRTRKCTGTLIALNRVVTAAHCVRKDREREAFPADKIHLERFTAAKSDSEKVAAINAAAQEAKARINFFGEEKNITVPKGTSILQALQDEGINAPFSCQSGVCSTCIATLTKGEVAMEFTEALDDDEIEEGLILTCQAKCITDEVEVIFED